MEIDYSEIGKRIVTRRKELNLNALFVINVCLTSMITLSAG